MPYTIPFLLAALAALAVRSVDASRQEAFLRSTGLLKFQPDKYQGGKRTHRYFEGWYYKFVSSLNVNNTCHDTENGDDVCGDEHVDSSVTSMAVVPGIFYSSAKNSNDTHAFVFVTLNGERQHYYRFDTSEFSYASAREDYFVQVGGNRFSHLGVSLDLRPRDGDDADLMLKGELEFTNPSPWPISLANLGAMGPVGWIPGLECTHGILSFDHVLNGTLTMAHVGSDDVGENSSVSFDDGRGYTEKDYGRSFPSLWVWIQTNSFLFNPGTSLFVSIARIPLLGMEFPGFTAAIWHGGELIPFATWSGARFEAMRASDEEVYIAMRSGRGYRVEISVDRRNVPEALLYAPVNFTKMAPAVWEALTARVHLRLLDGNGNVLVDDIGEYAGLEVHGNVQWLVDNVCGKDTVASKILCL